MIRSPQGQTNFAIACKIFVGWTEANRKHEISITLRDEDGGTYEPMPGEPFVIKSIIEVGRPAGLREGSEIDAPLALNIGGLPIVPGRYKLELSVGNNEITSVVFDVR